MSIKVTEAVVKQVAALARLEVSPDSVPVESGNDMNDLQLGMEAILDLAESMQAVNTDGLAPLANPLDAVQLLGADDESTMRQDQVTEGNQRDSFQAQAPATDSGLYLVPTVID